MGGQGSNQHTTQAKLGDVIGLASGTVVERPNGLRVTTGGTTYVVDVAGDHVVNPDAEDRHTIRAS